MNFEFSEQQLAVKEAVEKICQDFGEDYWRERDRVGAFPEEFVKAITDGGILAFSANAEPNTKILKMIRIALISFSPFRFQFFDTGIWCNFETMSHLCRQQ